MAGQTTHPVSNPVHVSLVALPDAVVSTLFGIYDVMNAFGLMGMKAGSGAPKPFRIEIVGDAMGPLELASGVPINVQRATSSIETSDIVIVPSVLLRSQGWEKGRYPRLVDWLHTMHDRGAVLCSARSGSFCWPRPDYSTARTPRCTLAMPGPSRPRIRRCRSIRSACSSSPGCGKNWSARALPRPGTT